jgi:hypothetical protein
MQRSPRKLTWLLAGLGVGLVGLAAQAGVLVMPPPGPARIAKADAVVTGKVEALEPEDVKVGNATYRIAVVKIKDGLRGVKDAKSVRVGFVPLDPGAPKVFPGGRRPLQLQAGQEGLFLLKKNAKENFYEVGGIAGYFFASDTKDFDKEIQAAKTAVQAIEEGDKGLKSKDAAVRLAATAILVDNYRTFRGPKVKQEPIDADESKLILQALAEGEWQAQGNFASLQVNQARLFNMLGVSKADGFAPPQGANFQTAAQTWLRENAGKYRVQRNVADK